MTHISSIGLSRIKSDYSVLNKKHSVDKKNSAVQASQIHFRGNEHFVDKSGLVSFWSSPLVLKKVQQEIDNKFAILEKNEPSSLETPVLDKDNIFIFSEQVKDILSKNDVNTPNAIIEALTKTANTSNEDIENFANTYNHCCDCDIFNANKKMVKKRKFLQAIIAEASNSPNPNSPLSQSDISEIFNEAMLKTNFEYDAGVLREKIKETIEYKPDDFKEEKIELNDEEISILKKALSKNPDEDIPLKDLYNKAINLYVGGNYFLKYLPERIQKAVLTSMPRYKSKDYEFRSYDVYKDFENSPVARWIYIKNPDEFVSQFEPNTIYSYDKLQSCSKNTCYCENQYNDDYKDTLVKFVIHPRSDVSRAYDLGERKYGNREVVYLPNQKFKVLGKKLVECNRFDIDDYSTKKGHLTTFYRYEIHMQEVEPESEVNNTEKVSTENIEKIKSPKVNAPEVKEDVFAKMIDDGYKAVENTKMIIDDVISPNLTKEKAIINNFDAESYPLGVADAKGNFYVKDEKLQKMFKSLAQVIPEYASIYGRKQHETHKYTLDVHTFKVLKECVNNPEYEKLSDTDKLVLQMAVLMHDIAKPAYINDREHPEKSAIMAEKILNKLAFPKDVNARIVNLIKNHNWFEHYNKGKIGPEEVLSMPLQKEDFSIMAIITQGDTKSINDWFYDSYCFSLPQSIKNIKNHI